MPGMFDRDNLTGALSEPEPAADTASADSLPPGVTTIDPTVGRPRRSRGPRRLIAGSVTWDQELLTKLRVTVAQEPGLTQRALNNELVRRFYELSAGERRQVIDAAKAWEKEQRP